MSQLRRGTLSHTLFVVLGVAVFLSWSCAPPPPITVTALSTWWVDVPSDDTAAPDNIHVSKKRDQRVIWHTNKAGKLSITWERANPFPELKCEGSVCLSGKVAADAYGPYVYHITIITSEKVASIDPTIMIDP
jgi:hypothetical protein